MPLTRKGAATRQRIVEGAAAEMRRTGIFSLTLDDVMQRTATSKSQLFHYFPDGKDQLLLAVARYEASRVISDQQPELGALHSWPAWLEWRDKVVDRYRKQGSTCPVNAVMGQLGATTEGARAVVTELYAQWQGELAAGIRSMQSQGEIAAELDAERGARALLAGIQGGVLIHITTGSLEHLEAVLDQGIESLRRSAAKA
ncbi:TetR family transcriptional regulator [Streptomyces sp. CB02923]|uniref:TetR/AcrR family transcriptional regulator n=1 Tax=Streptomyces sp. CB02923 TaxID=1718985 RepID=UPI00093BDB24|nr:TetR/AcrR family transcriptional regulator [Streptomyces sp. CB02923]OKH98964.1 TetR family transcriptional regulator [Streptomyces sp. CB02923]